MKMMLSYMTQSEVTWGSRSLCCC